MKRLFLIVVACFLLIGKQTQSVPTKFFEGFDTLLMPEYAFLDSLYGQLLAVKQDVLENFFESGNKKHPLTSLCQQLFFRRESDGSFAPTTKKEYISTYLAPYDFGWIIALALFKPDIFNDASIYSDCEKSKKVDQDVCAFLQKIKQSQQKKGITTPFTPKAVFKFINLIVTARKQAQEQFYDASIPVHMMLAAACMKATKKADLLDILRGISEHTLAEKIVFKQEQKAILAPGENNEKELFLKTVYEEKQAIADFKNVVENLTNTVPSQHSFLLQILTVLSFEMVQMLSIHDSPDCTESGLVELTRFLLYNDGLLDPTLLPEKLRNHQFIVNFVKQFVGKSVNDMEARTWFFDKLSGQKQLVYKSNQTYEMRALPKNILQGLNLIFGTNAKEWKELGSELSTERRTIAFELRDSSDPTKGNVVLTITEDGKDRTDELAVAPGHTEVIRAVDKEIIVKIEEFIKKVFGEDQVNSYPLCAFKNDASVFYSIGKQNQINTLLTHALKTTGFSLFCRLLVDPTMEPFVKAFFDLDRVVPSIDTVAWDVPTIIFQRYKEPPFSAYAVKFPFKILKEAFLGQQYQQNILSFLQYLKDKGTLESTAGYVVQLLMDRYESRLLIERFKNGALENLLMQIAEHFLELFSVKTHRILWERGDWYKISMYLAFEKFLVAQKADFFSTRKIGTMHELVLMQELKKPFVKTELLNMVPVFGEAILFDNKALFPTIQQEVIEKLPYTFEALIVDAEIKNALINAASKFGVQESGILLILSLLSFERLARQQNPQLKKEPHLLKKAYGYFTGSYMFLDGLIAFDKKYPHELWSVMVDEKQTFADIFVTFPFNLNEYQRFENRGLVIPQAIQNARKATPEERKKLLALYRPSSEVFTDFAYVLASF